MGLFKPLIERLIQVKYFLETETKAGWTEHINDETVEFIDYTKISKISEKKSTKASIVFL